MRVLSLVMPAPPCANCFAMFQNVKITESLYRTLQRILDVVCVNDEVEKPRARQMKREGLFHAAGEAHV